MKVPLSIRVLPAVTWKAWLTPPPLGTRTRLRDDDDTRLHRRILVAGGRRSRSETVRLSWRFMVGAAVRHSWCRSPIGRRTPGSSGHPDPSRSRRWRQHRREAGRRYDSSRGRRTGTGCRRRPLLRRDHAAFGVPGVCSATRRVVGAPRAGARCGQGVRRSASAVAMGSHQPPSSRAVGSESVADRRRTWHRPVPGAELLVLHDPDAAETPFAASATMAVRRPRTEIIPVSDVGHAGILSEHSVVETVAGHVKAKLAPDPSLTIPG